MILKVMENWSFAILKIFWIFFCTERPEYVFIAAARVGGI